MTEIKRFLTEKALIATAAFLIKPLLLIKSRNSKRIRFLILSGILILYARSLKINLIVYSFYRTPEQQQQRFKDKLSNADGYIKKSDHQYWLAWDILVLGSTMKAKWAICVEYRLLGTFWERIGGIWGHRWFEEGKTAFDDIYHLGYKG